MAAQGSGSESGIKKGMNGEGILARPSGRFPVIGECGEGKARRAELWPERAYLPRLWQLRS